MTEIKQQIARIADILQDNQRVIFDLQNEVKHLKRTNTELLAQLKGRAPVEPQYALQYGDAGLVIATTLFESRESAQRYAAPHADRLRVVPILLGEKND